MHTNQLYKTSDYWFKDMLNFNFSEKGLRLVSPPHFVYDFSRKMFLMLHSINWPNFFVWLPLLLEILCSMCITIVCLPGCDVIKFEISLIFLIKPFQYMIRKSRQKFKYLENEKSFWGEIKSLFIIFKGLSVSKYCLRLESAPSSSSNSVDKEKCETFTNWKGKIDYEQINLVKK